MRERRFRGPKSVYSALRRLSSKRASRCGADPIAFGSKGSKLMFKRLILTVTAVHVLAWNLSADTITRSALAPATTLFVTPASTSAGIGDDVHVSVAASNLADNFAQQFSILFDP